MKRHRRALRAVFSLEGRLAWRRGGQGPISVIFFVLVVCLFPFISDPSRLAERAPGFIWLAALLASLLGLDRFFLRDAQDGSLDLFRLINAPLEGLVLSKLFAYWVSTSLPIILVSPFVGLVFGLSFPQALGLGLSLLVGTPALTALGALGASLPLLLSRSHGLLPPLLTLPLSLPSLIFGSSCLNHSEMIGPIEISLPSLLLLTAFSLFILPLVVWGLALLLREA